MKEFINRSVYVLPCIDGRGKNAWSSIHARQRTCLSTCMLHVQNDDTSCITHNKYTQSRHAFLHLTIDCKPPYVTEVYNLWSDISENIAVAFTAKRRRASWNQYLAATACLQSALSTLLLKHNTWRKNFKTVNLLLTGNSWSQSMQHMYGNTVYKSWFECASYIRLIELGNLCEKFHCVQYGRVSQSECPSIQCPSYMLAGMFLQPSRSPGYS